MEAVHLTLNPEVPDDANKDSVEENQQEMEEKACLSKEEQDMVDRFAKSIDLTNTAMTIQYGAAAQKKIADFSQKALENVRTKDLGEIGNDITGLVTQLKGFDIQREEKGIKSWFKKAGNKASNLTARYEKAETNIETISAVLENHQIVLMKDIAMLDKLYETNLSYFKEVSMYIMAGQQKLSQTRAVDLPNLEDKAKKTGFPQDAQAANDLKTRCDSFEKKLHDLQLSRMVSIQMAPQIRLVQNNDRIMAEKIQSTLVNTIPLWKSQVALAMGITHSQQAIQAQRAVTDMTNNLLKKNSEMLHMASVETAKESERAIIDLETLQHTNKQLIDTLDEVLEIQKQGREKRQIAEKELRNLENEMRQKILENSAR